MTTRNKNEWQKRQAQMIEKHVNDQKNYKTMTK